MSKSDSRREGNHNDTPVDLDSVGRQDIVTSNRANLLETASDVTDRDADIVQEDDSINTNTTDNTSRPRLDGNVAVTDPKAEGVGFGDSGWQVHRDPLPDGWTYSESGTAVALSPDGSHIEVKDGLLVFHGARGIIIGDKLVERDASGETVVRAVARSEDARADGSTACETCITSRFLRFVFLCPDCAKKHGLWPRWQEIVKRSQPTLAQMQYFMPVMAMVEPVLQELAEKKEKEN